MSNLYQNRRRQQPRRSNNHYHMINTHFDNIHILANIIQDSQRLIENNVQRTYGPTIWNNSYDNMRNPPYYNIIIDTLRSSIRNQQTSTNSMERFQILQIDASNQFIHDSSNIHLFDVSHYSLIENPINDTCPISHEIFTPHQNVFTICECKHIFSKPQLEHWLINNNTCPSCRHNILS